MRRRHAILAAILGLMASAPAPASDGVVEINQARMAAGGVTSGDAPGSPVTLSEPGSYRLTSDLTLAGIHDAGILVTTGQGVTIDLGGFAIRGPFSCSPGACSTSGVGYGVIGGSPPPQGQQVTVRNGRITGMSGAGILLFDDARVENVDVTSCGDGVSVGARSHVVGNRIVRSKFRGLRFTGASALFERNVIAESGLGGVAGLTASVTGGTATGGNVCDDRLCRANVSQKRFYLTAASGGGNTPPTACDAGFHFASLWELLDPSALDYDPTRGVTKADAGSGPPTNRRGWIRTGHDSGSLATTILGEWNCVAYATSFASAGGTTIRLPNDWTTVISTTSGPWIPEKVFSCADSYPAWCVED